MGNDDLRFGDRNSGGSSNGGETGDMFAKIVEIFVSIILIWVFLKILDTIIFDGALPFLFAGLF